MSSLLTVVDSVIRQEGRDFPRGNECPSGKPDVRIFQILKYIVFMVKESEEDL